MYCEEKMRWVGEEKRKVGGYMGGGEKKKKKKWEVGYTCMVGKKGKFKKKKLKKKLKGKKLNWFYLYVHFI